MSSDAPTPQPQRRWQAACPGCGAPVEFASAASASAVCGFCRSTLVRDGEALRRIGVSAELFDDHSPLQLGASGTHQGLGFTLVGRLQYRYQGGTWNEWHALFDGQAGKSAWLSEDNGAYVLAFDQPAPADAPALAGLQAGRRIAVAGQAWSVASVVQASLIAAQGELPRPPRLQGAFTVADLRNERGEVGTLDDADGSALQWSIGHGVTLADLKLRGLRDGPAEATLAGRQFPCPSCGAPLVPTLASTKSLVCGQCHAVVDVSGGVGAELAHYAQANSGSAGREPQIPLGRTGRLDLSPPGSSEGALDWQVVGYQERCTLPAPGDDGPLEQFYWREYLLYHRTAGFAFLVDADEGWSTVRPLTGAPRESAGGSAEWQGETYRRREAYAATVTWVLGEFYWRVQQGEQAQVVDYLGPRGRLLSREQSAGPDGQEVVWSGGRRLNAAPVLQAFRVAGAGDVPPRHDAQPLSATSSSGRGLSQGVVILVVVIVVMLLMARCGSGDACRSERAAFGDQSLEYQQCLRNDQRSGGFSSGGGSFGGFSSGGGHK